MATNDMGTTPRGIQYPTSPTQFASGDWWKRLADSVDSAMNQVTKDTSWGKAPLTETQSLDGLAEGSYLRVGSFSTAQGYPISGAGTAGVESVSPDTANGFQVASIIQPTGSNGIWIRRKSGGVWGSWVSASGAGWYNLKAPTTKAEVDGMTTVDHVGVAPVSKSNRATLGIPDGDASGWLTTVYISTTAVGQRFTSLTGEELQRFYGGPNTGWNAWSPVSGGAGAGVGATSVTGMEATGEWTTPSQMKAYLGELDKHLDAELVTIGQTVKGTSIPALIIGDKTKPAFLAVGGQHGNELGNTHGLMLWARQLLSGETQIHMDMCFLIVPMLNLDNWMGSRLNANNVDLNRDWVAFTQPETKAVRDWIAGFNVIGAVDGHSFGYPREVSMRIPTAGTTEVRAKSQKMYDAITGAIQSDGQFVRQYDVENHPGMMPEGMATLGIPSLFTEIPSGYGSLYGDTPKPSPNWQQRMAALTMNAAAHEVWKWTPTYPVELVKSNNRDTGWRRIALPSGASGTLLVRRKGDAVHVQASNINGLTGSNTLVTLPAGMRPKLTAYFSMTGSAVLQVTTGGALQINSATATAYHVGGLDYLADHQPFPAPADYPGTAEN